LASLLEDHPGFKGSVPADFSAFEFISDVLGFQSVDSGLKA
jgi:hypothetical protein